MTKSQNTAVKIIDIDTIENYLVAGIENKGWYQSSNDSAVRFCNRYGLDLTTFLSVTAILSPRVQVVRNIRLARQWCLENKNPKSIMSQRVRALEAYHKSGIVTGEKVKAFRESLLLVDGACCIDIHMSRAFGYQGGELMRNTLFFKGEREAAQSIVRRLASKYQMPSYSAQSSIWCGYLELEAGYTQDRFKPMDFENV